MKEALVARANAGPLCIQVYVSSFGFPPLRNQSAAAITEPTHQPSLCSSGLSLVLPASLAERASISESLLTDLSDE